MPAGTVKKLTAKERSYYTAGDVQDIMDVSRDKAYRMIRAMREDLVKEGALTRAYPAGRIPKKIFNQLCMIEE